MSSTLAGYASAIPQAIDHPEIYARCAANPRFRGKAADEGGHIGIGQFPARALLEEPLHRVSRPLRHPRLTGALEWRSFLGACGLRRLPAVFDRR